MSTLQAYLEFAGSATALADLAISVSQNNAWPVDPDKLNERLVRYYVTAGVIDRPDRQGREATYGFRHLVQLLTARRLSERGDTLQVIAQHNQETTTADLAGSLFKPLPTEAQLLVQAFKRPDSFDGGALRKRDLLNDGLTAQATQQRRTTRQNERSTSSAKPPMAITDVLAEVKRMKDEWLHEISFVKGLQHSVDTLRSEASGQGAQVSEIYAAQRRLTETLEHMAKVGFEREQAFMKHVGQMIERHTYEVRLQLEALAHQQQTLIALIEKTQKRVDDS